MVLEDHFNWEFLYSWNWRALFFWMNTYSPFVQSKALDMNPICFIHFTYIFYNTLLFIIYIVFSYLPCRHTYHMIQTSRAGIRRENIHLSSGWGGIGGREILTHSRILVIHWYEIWFLFPFPFFLSFGCWPDSLPFRVNLIVASQLWVSPTVRRIVCSLDKYNYLDSYPYIDCH